MGEFAYGLKDTTTSLDFRVKYKPLHFWLMAVLQGSREKAVTGFLFSMSRLADGLRCQQEEQVGASGRTPFCAQLQLQVGVSRYQPGKLEGEAWRGSHGSSLLSAQVVRLLLLPGSKLDSQQHFPAAY